MGTWYVGGIPYSSDDICHFGRIGMKWGKNIFGKEGVAGKVGSSLGSAASGLVKKVSSGYNAGKQYIEDKTGITAKKGYKYFKNKASREGERTHELEMKRRSVGSKITESEKRLRNAEQNLDRNVENADKKWNQLQTRSVNDRNMADFYSRAAASARAKATTTTEPISMKQRRIEENTAREYQRQADERRQLGNQVRREQQQEFREADNQLRKAERDLDKAAEEREWLESEKSIYEELGNKHARKASSAAENASYYRREYENSLVGKVDKAVEKISKDKDKAVKSIKDWGSGAIGKGSEFVSGMRNKFTGGKNIGSDLKDTIGNKAKEFKDKASDKAKEVQDIAKDFKYRATDKARVLSDKVANKFNTQKAIAKEKAKDAIKGAKTAASYAGAIASAKANSIKEKGKNAIKAGKGLIDAIRYNKKKGGKKLIKGTAQPKKKNKG